MKVKFWRPGAVRLASMPLRSMTSLAGSKAAILVAAIANGEIGENVGALASHQILFAGAADKVRLANARK